MTFFPSHLDRFQRLMTSFALVVGIGLPAGVAVSFLRFGLTPWLLAPTMFIVLVAFATAFCYRPLGIEVSDRGLRVRRPIGGIDVPFAELSEIHGGVSWPPKSLGLFRSGGFFGTYGLFWAPSWGRFQGWTTRKQPLVALRYRDDRRMLVSVDDLAGFLAAVEHGVAKRGGTPVVHREP